MLHCAVSVDALFGSTGVHTVSTGEHTGVHMGVCYVTDL